MSRKPLFRRAPTRLLGRRVLLVLCASASLLALPSRAQDTQDVAEAARQEKARKDSQQKKESHVYTNEDLKQSRILIHPDRSRVEARKNNSPAAPVTPVEPSINDGENFAPESLGEVARRYRRQKLENSRAAEAAKRQPPSRFPMDLSQPSYASPVKPAAPLLSPDSRPRQIAKPLPRIAPTRRDPFSHQRFSQVLPDKRAFPSPNLLAPPKPAISLSDAAPHTPALVPRAAPIAPILNNPNSVKEIRVQPGDSLWKLARRHLSSGSRWNELLASNPNIADPNHLQPGAMLVVPATKLRSRARPSNITIQSGDSLWKIAASQLGSGAAWPCIAQANPHLLDANRLRPGQTLSIPAFCASHFPR